MTAGSTGNAGRQAGACTVSVWLRNGADFPAAQAGHGLAGGKGAAVLAECGRLGGEDAVRAGRVPRCRIEKRRHTNTRYEVRVLIEDEPE